MIIQRIPRRVASESPSRFRDDSSHFARAKCVGANVAIDTLACRRVEGYRYFGKTENIAQIKLRLSAVSRHFGISQCCSIQGAQSALSLSSKVAAINLESRRLVYLVNAASYDSIIAE
jgi:hypothetical protein